MRFFCVTVPAISAILALWSISNLNAAATWDSVAADFACGQKIQEGEQANGTIYQIEYLPAGEKLGSHSRLFTVTLTRLPQEETAANQQAEKSIQSMATAVGRAATKVVAFNRASTNHGPVAFFDYIVKQEYNIGVIARTGPGILTVYQLATVGGRTPTTEDRRRLRALIGLD